MKSIILLGLLLSLIGSIYADDGCRTECNPSQCQPPTNCLAGMVKDTCDCCLLCGKGEGERCYNATIARLPTSYSQYGECGENLECRLRTDLEPNDPPEATCICSNKEPICGTDGVTYDNECSLNEARYRRRDGLVAASRGPCTAEPIIVSPPEEIRNRSGSFVAFSCEVTGWPVPIIEWQVLRDVHANSEPRPLPSDDPRIAVQSRGGPSNFEITGWLQLLRIRPADQGTYFCMARNDRGQASASAKLVVVDNKANDELDDYNEI